MKKNTIRIEYDQLNRLVESRSYENGYVNNLWNPTSYGNNYHNVFSYDANGNIQTQLRKQRNGAPIDNLTYNYHNNSNGQLLSNRLYHVNDNVPASTTTNDIDDQGSFVAGTTINQSNNYQYDEEGRLVRDLQEHIAKITWRNDGKIKEITRTAGATQKNCTFEYDAMGNRIAKHISHLNGMLEKSTYYLLDAQGNQISMYEHLVNSSSVDYTLVERNIYGSSLLGVNKLGVNLFTGEPTTTQNLGLKYYHISNHLGNVLTVFSDLKTPITNNGQTVSGYEVTSIQTNDYSPFGAELDGRTTSGTYRIGFNGMEKDNEVSGNGNSYTSEFRQYDPRLGRWKSTDPLAKKYSSLTTYGYVYNSPIVILDMLGLGDPLEVMKIRRNRASNLNNAKARNNGGRAHQGFDLYAPVGTPVMAVKNAVVFDVSISGDYGKTITLEITDAKGVKTYAFYAHLSEVKVKNGEPVTEKDIIGLTGQTGNAQGQSAEDAHLHFEYRSSKYGGLGMKGRLNPNEVLDTKFTSQNPDIQNQATVGVIKTEKSGTVTYQNTDGSEIKLAPPTKPKELDLKDIPAMPPSDRLKSGNVKRGSH